MHSNFFGIIFHTFYNTFFFLLRILSLFEMFETYIFQVIFHFSIFIFWKFLFPEPDVCNLAARISVEHE